MRFGFEMIGIILIFALTFKLASATLIYDHGSEVKNSSGNLLESGNLTILIYDSSSGGNLIYNQSFTNEIINGSWNILIDSEFEYGKIYWKDYKINGDDLNFSGQNRIKFESSVGVINNVTFINFSLIDSCSNGNSIRQINSDGSVICESDNSGGSSGWVNDSVNTNTSLGVNVGGNVTTANYGFFGWLGSLASRVTKLFVVDIDVSGNVNASNFTLNGTTIYDWSEARERSQEYSSQAAGWENDSLNINTSLNVNIHGNLTIGEELLFDQSNSKIYVKGGELYVEY